MDIVFDSMGTHSDSGGREDNINSIHKLYGDEQEAEEEEAPVEGMLKPNRAPHCPQEAFFKSIEEDDVPEALPEELMSISCQRRKFTASSLCTRICILLFDFTPPKNPICSIA